MAQYPANIDLSSLDGTNGFKLSGEAEFNQSGISVASAGDVNGDHFADFIIGAFGGVGSAGQSYVVFGKAGGFGSNVDLSSLDGSNGFKLNGVTSGDDNGRSVASAGDVNGDGFDDLIIGAPGADPTGILSGASYVVFGAASGFGPSFDLSSINGANGFVIDGAASVDQSGFSVASAGDVNGDGFADLIIGAPTADPNGTDSGASFVVFGNVWGYSSEISVQFLDGNLGFKLSGAAAGDKSGYSVASAGDVNGDGFADVIVGAPKADPHGNYSGASYVVFGKASGFASNIDLSSLDGSNGFKLSGEGTYDQSQSGFSVASAGDVNGDGFADLVVGAPFADLISPGSNSGASYVVFGKASGFASNIDLSSLSGTTGFRISGSAAGDEGGWSVASAGDVNGDGFADLIVGAVGAAPHGSQSGASYVVFGKASGFSNIDLSSLDGTNGFKLSGVAAADQSGWSVASAGDVNRDGFADLIVGAPTAAPNALQSGASYVVLGRAPDSAVVRVGTEASQTLAGGAFDDTLQGLGGNDLIYGHAGNDGLDGGIGDDVLLGGAGIDVMLGGDGNDRLNGGKGADDMNGGADNDSYVVDDVGDVITETSGTDTVITRIDYTLGSGLENLRAGVDNDLILTGNDVANRIIGGAGDDTLTGGLGRDILTGGLGDDVFKYLAAGDSGPASVDRDVIKDFSAGDKIDLSAIDAIDGGGHDSFSFIGSGKFTAAGQVRAVTTAGGDTIIQANTGGTLAPDFSILLKGTPALTAADFQLS